MEAEVCMLRNSKKARMIRIIIPKGSEKQNNEMKSESLADCTLWGKACDFKCGRQLLEIFEKRSDMS